MKIRDLFVSQEKTFSFEFFPPRDEISAVDFGINVGRLMKLSPSFVTVTYGAGGSSQERTFKLVDYLNRKIGLLTSAHYTCVGADKEKVKADIEQLQAIGIENLMLLRGDAPMGQSRFKAVEGGFRYASELISFVSENYDFCISGAAYVEKHPEAISMEEDLLNLKAKYLAGADFMVTQFFFDNGYYFDFKDSAQAIGIDCRIIPGIIPLTSYRQIDRFRQMASAEIPADLIEKITEYKDQPKRTYEIGVEFAIDQCRELLRNGAPGLHFYTLNKSRAAIDIFESL